MTPLITALVLAGALAAAPVGLASGGPRGQILDPQFGSQSDQQSLRFYPSDRQAQIILTRIRTDADSLARALDPVPASGRTAPQRNGDLVVLVTDLQNASEHVTDHFGRRQVTRVDVEDLLRAGVRLNTAIPQRQVSTTASNAWTRLRSDLNDLATGYDIAWDWQNPQYTRDDARGGVYARLSGTYRLDTAASDNPQRAADRALASLPAADRTRTNRQITNRLTPPDVLAIDRNGPRVTMASSRQPQMTFDVDGRDREEQVYGRTITTHALFRGDALEVSTTGSDGQDFSVTFEPLSGGQSLQVTRRLYTTSLRQPVVVRSVYRRTSTVADWNVYDVYAQDRGTGARGGTVVPAGRVLVATLDRPLDLRANAVNNRVTLTVHDGTRSEFDQATIDAYVADDSAHETNRSGLVLDFDQIHLRNGRTAPFSGTIDRVRDSSGRTISVETLPESNSRNGDAIQRGAIGAGVGALIGAIAGGGKGAAIGAARGAAGGAGAVVIDGGGQNTLDAGTEFTIRSR